MQQTNTLLLFALYAAETQPAIVENVNDNLFFSFNKPWKFFY